MGATTQVLLEEAGRSLQNCRFCDGPLAREVKCGRCGEEFSLCTPCLEYRGEKGLCDYCVHMATKDD